MANGIETKGLEQPIIIKKVVKGGGGHHGGAWKVAYADFVTAMMAFFLLLWLLNVSTDEQKLFISNYFDPAPSKASDSLSGAGGVLGGLSIAPKGAMVSNQHEIVSKKPIGNAVNNVSSQKSSGGLENAHNYSRDQIESMKEALRSEEEGTFKKAKANLEKMIKSDPDLRNIADSLVIDITPEGLRIQIVDKTGRPMFASGSYQMNPLLRQLLTKVTPIVQKMPNDLSIRGHTDSVPYKGKKDYSNWELSADRANAARRELMRMGIRAARVKNTIGYGDAQHLNKDKPNSARNRRISIVLLKEELSKPERFENKAAYKASRQRNQAPAPKQIPIGTFRKSPGAVEFP